jgi:hypothetical protein
MQLIKDFSDIQKVVVLLNSENQNKLLLEINTLIVSYINEQNKPVLSNLPPVPAAKSDLSSIFVPAEPETKADLSSIFEPAGVQDNPEQNDLNDPVPEPARPLLNKIFVAAEPEEKVNPLLSYLNEGSPAEIQPEPEKPVLSAPPPRPVVNNPPKINPFMSMSDLQAGSVGTTPPPPPPALEGGPAINALRSSFAKSSNLPPPPPLPGFQQHPDKPLTPPSPSQPGPMGRNIAAGPLSLKGGFSGNKPQANKKVSLTILDCLGYIVPVMAELGKEILKSPATPTDVYQFLKQVDGEATLKHIYMYLFPNMAWGKYLEKVYPLSRERYLNFRKNSSFPAEAEIQIRIGDLLVSTGIINEADLEKALQIQKDPPKPAAVENTALPAWMEKAKSMLQQETSGQPVRKKLIGDTLVELGMINKDQLSNVLGIQRWLRGIVEQ